MRCENNIIKTISINNSIKSTLATKQKDCVIACKYTAINIFNMISFY